MSRIELNGCDPIIDGHRQFVTHYSLVRWPFGAWFGGLVSALFVLYVLSAAICINAGMSEVPACVGYVGIAFLLLSLGALAALILFVVVAVVLDLLQVLWGLIEALVVLPWLACAEKHCELFGPSYQDLKRVVILNDPQKGRNPTLYNRLCFAAFASILFFECLVCACWEVLLQPIVDALEELSDR